MTDNSTGCYNQDTVTIQLNRNPSEPIVSDIELCIGSTVELCPDCEEITSCGSSLPNLIDVNDPKILVTGLNPGTHTFKWTITGSAICNSGTFDFVTLIYEDPEISVLTTKCQSNAQNYDVTIQLENGTLFSINDGMVETINEMTNILSIDTSSQLQIIAVSDGNCRDTSFVSSPNCLDCLQPKCLPMTIQVRRGKR